VTPVSQATAILLMLNNYVHDVATGLLLISAFWVAWSARELGDAPSAETLAYFRRTYRRSLRFVVGSIAGIVLTGVPRTVYFMELEWHPAMGKGLIPVLVAKHVLIFTMLGVGFYAWVHLRRRLRRLGMTDGAAR
jgi:hypothetical protein